MARYARSHGGFFDERDFAAQRAEWGEPLRATYRGVTIYETPPPTQGLSVLQMLGLRRAVGARRGSSTSDPTTCTCSCRRR